MRKVYLVMGTHTGKEIYSWVSGVYTSMKKAQQVEALLKKERPENYYETLIYVLE